MENNTNSFEKKWQDAFSEESVEPSNSVWESIEKEIITSPTVGLPSKGLPKYYIGTALVGFVGIIAWLVIQNNSSNTIQNIKLPKENSEIIQKSTPLPIESKVEESRKENKSFAKPLVLKEKIKTKVIQPEIEFHCDLPVTEHPQERIAEEEIVPILSNQSVKNISSNPLERPKIQFQEPTESETYYKEMPKKVETIKDKPKVKVGFGIGIN
ncbi:MAG: hypothetical protein KA313_10505 [Pseudarcicella sp.]|nr:hypothetical protein [Pseudarcicella sp.]MBP6411520.1 hypothetical protein [Pseudarcicella sp.]